MRMWCRVFCLVSCAAMGGCGEDGGAGDGAIAGNTYAGGGPAHVVCTTGQVADAVQRIGGEHLEVTGLIGPGVDPHLYQATLSDMRLLKEADMIFLNGMHLEGRMADTLLKFGRRTPTFPVTEGLQEKSDPRLRTPAEFEGHFDPHVWHNAELWSDCVQFIADQLAGFDPEHADLYQRNAQAYTEELKALHVEIQTQIATIPKSVRLMVTAHDAFGYFGDAYGIEVFGLKGISTDDEVSIQRMEEIVELLVDRKVPAVFVESAVAPRIVEALIGPCRDAGHDVTIGGELYADALGAKGSGAENYVGMMRANLKTIVNALSKTDAVKP